MIIGAILAAGKGTRINAQTSNKTTLLFNGKPLIQYAVEVYKGWADRTIVTVGVFKESVIEALKNYQVDFLDQGEPLGTGHAVQVVVEDIKKRGLSPTELLVGYGDHMMFYTPEVVRKMIKTHQHRKATVTLITTKYSDPDLLGWGRILRGGLSGHIKKVVEQKDATTEERKVQELNAGFYCFYYHFVLENKNKINKSSVSGEYYINEFIDLAIVQNKTVIALDVDFKYVGIGINTQKHLEDSQKLYKERDNE